MTNLTTEEKIDFIYKEIKTQKKSRYFKLFIQIMLIVYFMYFIYNISQNFNKDEIVSGFSENISKIVKPIVENITDDIINTDSSDSNINTFKEDIINKFKEDPELIDNY